MNEKKTGLGSSLLLARTEGQKRPSAEKSKPASDVAPQSEPAKEAEPPIQDQAPSTPKPTELPRDRCTIYLEQDINQRLDLTARIERKPRWQVVNALLERYLPVYQVQRENPDGADTPTP